MSKTGRRTLPLSSTCFVCGDKNPIGLRSRFFVEDDIVHMTVAPTPHHCGYPDVMHGGLVATALDECMVWAAARALGLMCVTAKMTVRYVEPVKRFDGIEARAWVTRSHRRIAYTAGELIDGAGKLYARSEGSFIPLSAEETLRIDNELIYRGDEERVFEHLRAATKSGGEST